MLYCKRPRQHRPKQRRPVSPGVCPRTATSVNVPARRWCASDRCVVGSSLMFAVRYTTQDTIHDHRSRTRGANPALLSRREVARRHHRAPIACSPRNSSWGAGPGGPPRIGCLQRPSQIDAYLPFIHETLKKFPSLTASRLYAMVCERGYRGNHHHFRHLISVHRPRPVTEAYLRLRTLPGEQGQVDWAHFDHLQIGRARRPLMAFVMVLSWSRQIYLRFFLDARMDSFLAGHAGAFEAWSGLPRVLLYDNLKSAVLERHGDAIRFNPQLLAFAAHHRYEPRPVAVARGNEYGVVKNMCCSITN